MSDKINIGDEIKFGHLEWRVLDVQDGKALIISKTSACNSKFDESDGIFSKINWENSDIRVYLNDSFLQYLTGENPDLIIETKVINSKKHLLKTQGGNDTFDKVFLLSIEEAGKYFKNDSERKLEKDIFSYMGWWLRSPGESNSKYAYVDDKGEIIVSGYWITQHKNIRPVMWIKLDLAEALKNGNPLPETNPVAERQALSEKRIEFGPYDWRILDVQGDKALIITEDIIAERQYHSTYYLNEKFLEKFTNEELERISETQLPGADNLWYETKDSGDKPKKVFLLSIEEAEKYFGGSDDYISKRRKKYGGAIEEPSIENEGRYMSNIHNDNRKATFEGKPCQWWLRTLGSEKECLTYYPGGQIKGSAVNICCTYVRKSGSIDVYGVTDREYNPKYRHSEIEYGVRPALWLLGYQDFYKDESAPTAPEVWPPETEPSTAQLLKKIPSMENSQWMYHEGYVYFIPKDGILKLMKARSDGKEITTVHSTGNESGSSQGWHRSEYCSFKMQKIEDGYLYLIETSKGDNDYSEWDNTSIYRLKLDGSDKLLNCQISIKNEDPSGKEHYTSYYDEDGNLERTDKK